MFISRHERKDIVRLHFLIAVLLVLLLHTNSFADDTGVPDEPETYNLPELSVTAQRETEYTILPERDIVTRPMTEAPGLDIATSVIGRKEIEELHAYSLIDAMNFVPGAWTETRGRKIKQFFSVRGQRYPYPGYLVDGAWFREFHEINYYLSAANFDRIEILRSSSALLLGPGGLTGMVNLSPRAYNRKETQAEVQYGSLNTYRVDLSHGNQSDKYGYGFGVGYFHTDGASKRNAAENMLNLYGRLQYRLSHHLMFSWSNYFLYGDREFQLALPPASKSLQTRRESFDPMRTYLTVVKLRYEREKNSATELIANYGGKRFDAHQEGSPDQLEEEDEYGASIIHSRELGDNNTLRITGLFHRWATPTGKRFYVGNPGDIRTYSAAIADEHDFGRVDVGIGYRYTREHTEEFGGFNVEGSSGPLSAVKVNNEWSDPLHAVNFGASVEIAGGMSLFGNASWGQLASQLGMLDQNYNRPGTEERYKYDLGARWRGESYGELILSGFYTRRNDAALVSQKTVLLDDEPYALYTTDDQESYGVEMDFRSRFFSNGMQFFLNATLMKARRTLNDAWIDDEEVPELILGGGVLYRRNNLDFSLYAKHVGEYENERFLPANSPPAALGDYIDLTGQVTYRAGRGTEIFARIENMIDDEYSTAAGYPHEGTLCYIGAVKRF